MSEATEDQVGEAEADLKAEEAAAKTPAEKPAAKAPAKKKPAAKKPTAKKATPKATKPDEDTKPRRSKRPSEYVVKDETHYSQVADKFGFANYRELGAYNGVHNSRYDLERGQVVKFPAKPLPGS